jgi:ATP-dependent Clp protease ATP-binding subunit ClpA
MPTTSDKADIVINNSFRYALKYNHEYLTTEHLMYGILSDEPINEYLKKFGIDIDEIVSALSTYIENDLNEIIKKDISKPKKTLTIDRIFQRAFAQALVNNKTEIDCLDILCSILHESNSPSVYFANIHGLDKEVLNDIIENRQVEEKNEKSVELLENFCEEITEKIDEKINYCLCREHELNEIIVTLSRLNKSNVMIVGESGVGKTTLIWGIAEQIVKKKVKELENYKIYSLNTSKLIAGTRFRGDLEERINLLGTALSNIDNVIVFVDEIHTLGTSNSENGMDIFTMLKPMLESNNKIIGSTTNQEYRKYIENDKGFTRRFSLIKINEPNPDQCFTIIKNTIKKYESYHNNIGVGNDVIKSTIKLTKHWIKNKYLPDSAFDIIDKSLSRKKINNDFTILSDFNIRNEISKSLHIPLENITSNNKENTNYEYISDKVSKQVFGQSDIIVKISKFFAISKMGLKDPSKPIGNFLLIGPTGVGKTEVVKAFSQVLSMKLVRFDMSEYQEKHSVSKLIGSPPGYVGFNDGESGSGLLVNKIEENPNSIILFDEIEKAHPDITTVLLQLLDEGTLTNSTGKSVDARNCAIFMTSNLGIKEQENNTIGFGSIETNHIIKEVNKYFSPEFRNRLDEILHFNYLNKDQLIRIIDKFIGEINTLLLEKNLTIMLDPTAVEYFIKEGYNKKMGARPMKRIINKIIKENLIGIISKGYKDCTIHFYYKDNQIQYKI